MSRINSIRELTSAFGVWSLSKKVIKFFKTCLSSCKNSKINFFLQVINFCLIILFFWFILPSELELLVNSEGLASGIFGNFVLWIISIILFPISKIFESSAKVTITIFLTIIFIITFCYIKLITKALSMFKLRITHKIYGQ